MLLRWSISLVSQNIRAKPTHFSHSKISDLSYYFFHCAAMAMATASGAPVINSRDQKQLFRNLVPLLWATLYTVSSRTIFSDFASMCSYALIHRTLHGQNNYQYFLTANGRRMPIITRYRMTTQRTQLHSINFLCTQIPNAPLCQRPP